MSGPAMSGVAGHSNKPKSWFSRFFSPRIEDSVRLRVLTLASLWLGGLGLYWVGGDFRLTLLAGVLGTAGYWLGWRLRHRRAGAALADCYPDCRHLPLHALPDAGGFER